MSESSDSYLDGVQSLSHATRRALEIEEVRNRRLSPREHTRFTMELSRVTRQIRAARAEYEANGGLVIVERPSLPALVEIES